MWSVQRKVRSILVASLYLSCLLLVTEAWAGGCGGTPRNSLSETNRQDGISLAKETKSTLFMSADEDTEMCLSRKPKKGDVVTVDLLKFQPAEEDFVPEPLFDMAGTHSFVLHGGGYLPGLHKLLDSMMPGETIRDSVLDAGFGAWNPDMSMKVSKADVDLGEVKVGMKLSLSNGMQCSVTEVTEDDFTVDANHPMAGASYLVDLTLVSVEEGPASTGYVAEGSGAKYEVATFALGCFWGGELAYQRAPGVVGSKVGYTQGQKENPSYEEVCAGTTGHTEAIQVVYDSSVISYESLVKLGLERLGEDVYLLNQVGNDRGTQYRSGIYYHNDAQKEVVEKIFKGYGEGTKTELKAADTFYDAEDYHQQYLLKGGQSAKKSATETIRCYG